MTYQHISPGANNDQVEITRTGGAKLQPHSLEIVPRWDLARIAIARGPAALAFATDTSIGDPSVTVGDSLDAGEPLWSRAATGSEMAAPSSDCEVVGAYAAALKPRMVSKTKIENKSP